VACRAVWYAFEPDGYLLGGRIVARPCGAETGWREPHCPAHARQLAEADRLGLEVPDPAAFPPAPAAEQPALL
jgi:hypothetical protein